MPKSDLAFSEAVRRLEQRPKNDRPDQYELYFEHRASTRIDSKDQKIDSLARSEDVGLAVRLVKNQRMGFSYTTSLEPAAIARAIDTALEVAQSMPEDPFCGIQITKPAPDEPLRPFTAEVYDAAGLRIPLEKKIALAKKLEASCREADSRITGVRAASIGETTRSVRLKNSLGLDLKHRSTVFTATVTCKAEFAGDSQMGSEFAFSNFLDQLEVEPVGHRAASFATELLGAGQAPTLKCPAVLRNSVVADLLEFLSESFSAEQMDKGRSMLRGKEGQLLFSEKITLIDDGLLSGGLATSPFDGEGTSSSQTQLVDAGHMNGALYDGYFARKMGKTPTGNSARGIKSPPSIQPTNLYLIKGHHSSHELISGISRGMMITDLMGLHTANPVTGDFSLGASGILIENGKLVRPVKGFAVAGNVLELFRRMTDIGNDLKFFGSIGAPSVRVSELSVGGA